MATKVYKQLATMQDLALGHGKVIQRRNGVDVELDKIDIGKSFEVNTIAELRTRTVTLNERAIVNGFLVAGDGLGGPDRIGKDGQAPGFYVDDGFSTIVPGDGSSAWLLKQRRNDSLELITDIATKFMNDQDFVYITGDIVSFDNALLLVRRPDLDDNLKAGDPPEIINGTWRAWDASGATFIELKTSILNRERSEGKQSGKQVHSYEWGSPYGGNDWCFVRTPPNYSPSGKPHPLLILNHGNGWIMDGTPATENFSAITQFGVDTQNGGTYLDTGRPDYVQYSSPMIEAFLAEGYIVCGAQNDGQHYSPGSAAFGNREVRQNVKMFFDHMQRNYNVEPWCHMLGASNGGLATLNAATIMGRDIVRSIILLYPLTNLYRAWQDPYQASVATAYGIDPANSFTDFMAKTDSHDPCWANTVFSLLDETFSETILANANFYRLSQDGVTKDVTYLRENRFTDSGQASTTGIGLSNISYARKSVFPWPRIRCHWSAGDGTAIATKHWQAFEKLLDRGNYVSFSLEVLGDHGDYRHFEGLDGFGVQNMINWTKL